MLKKVLIVDDSELIHRMYRILALNRYECEVGDAMNGQEALDILGREDDFQLILLDINMPVMNGLQFMQRASELGIAKRIPIIVISTDGKEEDSILALKLGARGYLKKPFNPNELHSLIGKIFPNPVAQSAPIPRRAVEKR